MTMKKIYRYSILPVLLLSACSDDVMHIDSPDAGLRDGEVRINAEIDQVNLTRADDSGFADEDVIGVFAVDFQNGEPGILKSSGNNADNVDFTFDESTCNWSGSKAILFKDDKTPLDLYGYYPYIKEINEINRFPFSVQYNQAGDDVDKNMSAYEASDFLWAKSAGLTLSNARTTLYFKHLLASVRVSLVEGKGFSDGEWSNLDKFVTIDNTSRNASINLANGEVICTGEKDNYKIIARESGNDFRAIVVPQCINAGEVLMTITVDNRNYKFIKNVAMDYIQHKQHNFTIEVNKNVNIGDYEFILTDESITSWESDNVSHNGQAKEYLTVDLNESESLREVIESKRLDPNEIINLKLTGPMTKSDFEFIRRNMTNLEAINLMEIDLSGISDYIQMGYVMELYDNILPPDAFLNLTSLKYCVLPKKFNVIGSRAFAGTSLTGSLDIPEGVTIIGEAAYMSYSDENWSGQIIHNNNLHGILSLPSTLKHIEANAFKGCDFTGTLLLPDGLETIGSDAFAYCRFFSGDLRVPESVTSCGGFRGMSGIDGWIILPHHLKEVGALSFLNARGIQWPDAPTTISWAAFENSSFKQDLKIPESVLELGEYSFRRSKIKHIILPPEIVRIPNACFQECTELSDTLTIPSKVMQIDDVAFANCSKLDAIILPASLQRIAEYGFANCYNVTYMRCDATEPPIVADNAFYGIEKDNFTLEVPEQSVDAYRNAPGWCEFKRISAYRNFVARPSKYNVLNKGGKKEIILNADADWEMTECPSWCHVDKKTGNKKTTITLTVDALAKGSPMRNGKITFRLKGSDEHLTHIDVGQYDYEYDEDQPLTLQKATKGNGIDLVFLGDGYDAADISSGMYLEDMKQELEYLFGVEPYTTYRDYFNVYTAISLSEDSGVENINQWRNTKFDVCTGDGKNQRITANYTYALDYCAQTFPSTVNVPQPRVGCILIGNTELYEGVTYTGDSFCSVITKSTERYPYDARGLVQHEAGGHGIGWLVDEYMYHAVRIQKCTCSCCEHLETLLTLQSTGFGLNLSQYGKHESVPWSHLIFHPSYGDIVDIYEGGYFHTRGIYRSEINSCMNNNVPYFSTWSRQLIVERIMKLAGEKFDINSFYAKDSRATGKDFTSTSRSGARTDAQIPVRHGNPPIRITNYKYGKKGGKR
ncbi:MAG: fimbrillin family protein [Muribaculaceae bacterium]|nr:fimbrillin family protein [Muribaculaceae bacterium]